MRSGLVVLAALLSEAAPEAAQPDVQGLIAGVISAREQIPASRLHLRCVYADPFRQTEREYMVHFDGERYRFWDTNSPHPLRAIFNGSEVLEHCGPTAVIRNLGDPHSVSYMFDPRLLGLGRFVSPYATIRGQLWAEPSRQPDSLLLIGKEMVSGRAAWHARIEVRRGLRADLWIGDTNGFPVYRYVQTEEGGRSVMVSSVYEPGRYPWLPVVCTVENRKANGNLDWAWRFDLLDAQAEPGLPEATWTLAGLGLPDGLPVADLRINRRIGYWRGGRLVPEGGAAGQAAPAPPPLTVERSVVLAVLGVILLAPVAAVWLRWRRVRRRPPDAEG